MFHGNVSSIFNEKKLTKIEGKFENEENQQKKKIFAFVEGKFENEKNLQKKKLFA